MSIHVIIIWICGAIKHDLRHYNQPHTYTFLPFATPILFISLFFVGSSWPKEWEKNVFGWIGKTCKLYNCENCSFTSFAALCIKHIKNERCNGPLGLIVYDFIIYLLKGSNRNAPNDKTRFFHIIKNSTLCIGEQLAQQQQLYWKMAKRL